MFIQAVKCDRGCFIIAGPVQVRTIIFKMLIDLEGRTGGCSITQKKIRGSGHQVFLLIPVPRIKYQLDGHYFFCPGIYGIYLHAVS